MTCTYILISKKDGFKYIGSTFDIQRRLQEHNSGQVKSTRNHCPFYLLGYRKCHTIQEAALWEKKYKRSHGQLDRDIQKGIIKITGA